MNVSVFTNDKRTLDPEITQINLFYGSNFLNAASDFSNLVNSYRPETDYHTALKAGKVSNDPISSQANLFIDLHNGAFDQMDAQFVASYLDKFNTSLELVRRQVISKVGRNGYFQQISDSIGLMARTFTSQNIYDDTTCPIIDVNSDSLPIPSYHGTCVANKLSYAGKSMALSLSKITNSVFRSNIAPIQEKVNTSTNSHGQNLVSDSGHVKRMNTAHSTIIQNLQTQLQGFYKVIDFYNSYNPNDQNSNLISVPPYTLSVNVEGIYQRQDILKKPIMDTLHLRTTSGSLS